jgi:hypothetical protein
MGLAMANISASAPAPAGEFRVGRVLSRAIEVLARHFLLFVGVTLVAWLLLIVTVVALVLLIGPTFNVRFAAPGAIGAVGKMFFAFLFILLLCAVLYVLAQAVVLYGAFQAMRERPVNLGDCLKVAFSRFFPIVGIAICWIIAVAAVGILTGLISAAVGPPYVRVAISVMIFFGLCMTLVTMWFVAIPACIVERLGPLASIGRSNALTKGCRWKIFGMILLVFAVTMILSLVTGPVLSLIGKVVSALGSLALNGVMGAFYAIYVAVTYHDLRVAKEGVDTDQIAAVFD